MKLTAKVHQLTESNLAQIQWQDCEHSCGSAHGAWLLYSRTGRGTWEGSSGYLAALLLRLLNYSLQHHFSHLEKKKKKNCSQVYFTVVEKIHKYNTSQHLIQKSFPGTELWHYKEVFLLFLWSSSIWF